MSKVRCPACGKVLSYKKISDFPYFPFCSERCSLVDLGKWFNEEYSISEKLEESEGVPISRKPRMRPQVLGPEENSQDNRG